MKHRRPQTSEEEVRRENGKLKVQLAALANMDKTRAQLANEIADLKTRLQEKDTELHETKNHNQRAAFNEQRAAIKEFTERVQAELEKENRHLQTRCAMAEEQIKEINAYMAQSTLAYQKEIMRLRSIIQATAPERLKTPTGLGPGGFASKKAATRARLWRRRDPPDRGAERRGIRTRWTRGGRSRKSRRRREGARDDRVVHGNEPRARTTATRRMFGETECERNDRSSASENGLFDSFAQSVILVEEVGNDASSPTSKPPRSHTLARPSAIVFDSSRMSRAVSCTRVSASSRLGARATRRFGRVARAPARAVATRDDPSAARAPSSSSAPSSAASPRSARRLPVVDLSESDAACASVIRDALFDGAGFFHVRNHGVPKPVVDAVVDAGSRFFDQPLAAKLELARGEMRLSRGYEISPEHVEAILPDDVLSPDAEATSAEPSAARRIVGERFSVGPFDRARDDDYHAGEEGALFFAPNAWPDPSRHPEPSPGDGDVLRCHGDPRAAPAPPRRARRGRRRGFFRLAMRRALLQPPGGQLPLARSGGVGRSRAAPA